MFCWYCNKMMDGYKYKHDLGDLCMQFASIWMSIISGLRQSKLNMCISYNLINNFSIISCGARRARSCAAAYLLTGAQRTLRTGIASIDRELFHQIITVFYKLSRHENSTCFSKMYSVNKLDFIHYYLQNTKPISTVTRMDNNMQ